MSSNGYVRMMHSRLSSLRQIMDFYYNSAFIGRRELPDNSGAHGARMTSTVPTGVESQEILMVSEK